MLKFELTYSKCVVVLPNLEPREGIGATDTRVLCPPTRRAFEAIVNSA